MRPGWLSCRLVWITYEFCYSFALFTLCPLEIPTTSEHSPAVLVLNSSFWGHCIKWLKASVDIHTQDDWNRLSTFFHLFFFPWILYSLIYLFTHCFPYLFAYSLVSCVHYFLWFINSFLCFSFICLFIDSLILHLFVCSFIIYSFVLSFIGLFCHSFVW